MDMKVRRVVTGHDENGRAKVLIDGDCPPAREGRPNCFWTLGWANPTMPLSNDDETDLQPTEVGTTYDNGVIFRIIDFHPGVAPRSHRTNSIDYAVVMSGEIDMELEPGEEVHFKAGDVFVQRGTIHNWINRGTEVCRVAFVLVGAQPAHVNGQPLPAQG